MKRFYLIAIMLLISITIVGLISRSTDSQVDIPENWIHFDVSSMFDDSNGFRFFTPPDVKEIPAK